MKIGTCILCITANGEIFAGEKYLFRGVDFRGDIETFCVGCTVELLYETHHVVLLQVRIDETKCWEVGPTDNSNSQWSKTRRHKALIVVMVGFFLFSITMGSGLTSVL